jgi:hypothetical protein
MKKSAVAVVEVEAKQVAVREPIREVRPGWGALRPGEDLEAHHLPALRARLGGADREAVLVDFLEDDLREAQQAMAAVAGHLAAVTEALSDPRLGRERLVQMALDGEPLDRLDYLSVVLVNLRKRMAQVAGKL